MKEKVKILFNSNSGYPNPNTGGPNRIIYELIRKLNREDYIVDFLSNDLFIENISNDEGPELYTKKINITKKLTGYLYKYSKLYRLLTTNSLYLNYHFRKKRKRIKNIINGKKYDIIHSHSSLSLNNLLTTNAKKILTIHSKGSLLDDMKDSFVNQKYLNKYASRIEMMEAESFNRSDIITFPSIAAQKLFLNNRTDKLKNNNIHVIYNGIDVEFISQHDANPLILEKYNVPLNCSVKLLNVANHVKPKRIDFLLKVIHELKNKHGINAFLIQVGIGPESNFLEKQVEMLNIQNNVKFIPFLARTEIIDLMKLCDYFIMVSEKVIFDMAILEAIASGICVIASNEGGNTEVIKNGVNGFLVDKENSEGIIAIIKQKLKLNKEIQIQSLKEFSEIKMLDNYTELYNLALSRQ